MTTSTATKEKVEGLVSQLVQQVSHEKGVSLMDALDLIDKWNRLAQTMVEKSNWSVSHFIPYMEGIDGDDFIKFYNDLRGKVRQILGTSAFDEQACQAINLAISSLVHPTPATTTS